MNLYNFLRKFFFNNSQLQVKKGDTFKLIEETIKKFEEDKENYSEKVIALYILNKLKREEKVEFNTAKESLQKLLGKEFVYKNFKKIFKAISTFLMKNS